MRKREGKDIWKGLYDFPLIEMSRPQKTEMIIRQAEELLSLSKKLKIDDSSPTYRHVLSHQILHARFIFMQFSQKQSEYIKLKKDEGRFYTKASIHKLPKPILINRYLQDSGIL